jgi:aspartate/methionine/tyrosine aminotransferase
VAFGRVHVRVRRPGRPAVYGPWRTRLPLTHEPFAKHHLELPHLLMHVKRDALARGNVEPVDAGVLRLIDDINRPEGLPLDFQITPCGRALDCEGRNGKAPKRAGLGESDKHRVDLRAALVGRWGCENISSKRVTRGFEEAEATTTQEEHELRCGGSVVDGRAQAFFDGGCFGFEAHLDVDSERLRSVALVRVHADDTVDHQLLDAQDVHDARLSHFETSARVRLLMSQLESTSLNDIAEVAAFRPVPRTGVIYVTVEAQKRGFRPDAPGWCNLGQGQPDTGHLAGAPERVTSIPVHTSDLDYAPVAGVWELREAVAGLYNTLFRRGMKSQYSAENVCIAGGGRVAVMRACAAIAPIHLGHFLPDYTAYEELLDVFRRFLPIPILLDPKQGYEFSRQQLEEEILGRGLSAILASNPCNPTGKAVHGDTLASWVETARDLNCALLLDEFYSHYVWTEDRSIVSAAEFVENVDKDPIVLFDGLTKNWRYPGFRVSWIVGPKRVVESTASAGSFLDGGGVAPMQRAAIDLVQEEPTLAETKAIHDEFRKKRNFLVSALKAIGVRFDLEPQGTFYAWGDLSGLPPSLRNSDDFFKAALERQVICVPGHFFDVNPGKRRTGRPSRFLQHMRFSFGPPMPILEQAVDRLRAMVAGAQ